MTNQINGKQTAADIVASVKTSASHLLASKGLRTGLAVVIVGDDPASHTYVGAKGRVAKECGFNSIQHTLPEATDQETLEHLIRQLNQDTTVHGILVQLPLPTRLDSDRVIQLIHPNKDADGLHILCWETGRRRSQIWSAPMYAGGCDGADPPNSRR